MGISFAAIFVRLALPAPPVISAFYRMLFASLLVGAWLVGFRRGQAIPRPGAWYALGAGLCFGSDLALWHTAIVHTSVANATLLVNTTPILVGLYSALVLRERPDTRFWAGAALALAGSALLLGFRASGALGGDLLALGAAVFYSGYLLLMKATRRGVDTAPALFLTGISATGVLGLYAVLGGDDFRGYPAASWAAMLGAALVSHLGGVMAIVWALRYLRATAASVALLAQPVGTAALGWLVLGESLESLQALGALGVLAGIALAARSGADPAPG